MRDPECGANRKKVHSTKYLHKKVERSHTRSLTPDLKALEEKEVSTHRKSRQQEIIKLRIDIKIIDTKIIVERINETKRWLFEKSTS